jgi:hypothetical protein
MNSPPADPVGPPPAAPYSEWWTPYANRSRPPRAVEAGAAPGEPAVAPAWRLDLSALDLSAFDRGPVSVEFRTEDPSGGVTAPAREIHAALTEYMRNNPGRWP